MSVGRIGYIGMTALLAATVDFAAAAGQTDLPILHFEDIREIAKKKIGFSEPSGLAFDADGQTLWSVSDETPALFRISAEGNVIAAIPLGKTLDDLEGITLDMAGNRLLAVRERSTEIVAVGLADTETVTRHPLEKMAGYAAIAAFFEGDGRENGLEGIAADPADGSLWLVKEKHPRLLINISGDLGRIVSVHILSADIGFVDDDTSDGDLDLSGIAVDPGRGALWIISDTGERLFQADRTGAVKGSYPLLWEEDGKTHALKNAEGVALSADGTTLHIVSDDKQNSRLVRYTIR